VKAIHPQPGYRIVNDLFTRNDIMSRIVSPRTFLAALLTCVATAVFPTAGQAAAGEPVSLGAYGDWQAFTYDSSGNPVCYIFSKPTASDASRRVKRDEIHFMVSHWPGRQVFGEVSTIIGYPFKEDSVAELKVGDRDYTLPTSGDSAWVQQPAAESEIIASLKNGSALRVRGTSVRGTETTDTYSLNGFTAALSRIDQACK
jgi:invasion protein IalB